MFMGKQDLPCQLQVRRRCLLWMYLPHFQFVLRRCLFRFPQRRADS